MNPVVISSILFAFGIVIMAAIFFWRKERDKVCAYNHLTRLHHLHENESNMGDSFLPSMYAEILYYAMIVYKDAGRNNVVAHLFKERLSDDANCAKFIRVFFGADFFPTVFEKRRKAMKSTTDMTDFKREIGFDKYRGLYRKLLSEHLFGAIERNYLPSKG